MFSLVPCFEALQHQQSRETHRPQGTTVEEAVHKRTKHALVITSALRMHCIALSALTQSGREHTDLGSSTESIPIPVDRNFFDPLMNRYSIHPPLTICSAFTSISDAPAVYRLNTPVAAAIWQDFTATRFTADSAAGSGGWRLDQKRFIAFQTAAGVC